MTTPQAQRERTLVPPPAATSRTAPALAKVLAIAIAVLALTASTALGAVETHAFTTYFGAANSTPANPYPLSHPTAVAVDRASHDFYVSDPPNHRIEKFDSSGHLLLMFGKGVNKTEVVAKAPESQQDVCVPTGDECQSGSTSATSTPGTLNTPSFVAVDNSTGPSAGDVYVADTLGDLVSKFDSSGNLIANWNTTGQLPSLRGFAGIAVDSGGDLVVMDGVYPERIFRYSESGANLGEFGVPVSNGTLPHGIAIDAAGHLYKGGSENNPRVTEFDESGVIAETITPGPITGLAADPMTSDLFTDEHGTFISHFKSRCGENCASLETFGSGKLSEAAGISVDAPSDDVYVANAGGNNVAVFGGEAPYTTTGAASTVGRTTATITGHIAEGGRGPITGCHFVYGLNESYELGSVPCVPGTPYGTEADVTAQLTGLAAESVYHYRLVASNAAATIESADLTVAPHFVIQGATDPAINVSFEGAELAGSYVGDGNDTKYFFEYGTNESYGQSTPEQDDGSKVGPRTLPPAVLVGLHSATTYHFRLVATNSFGTTYGQDRQFTTFGRPSIDSITTMHVTATMAELHAVLNPNGGDTKYRFEYGLTTNYGTNVPSPPEDIGSAFGRQEVVANLTGLQIGATYHFRVVAENPYGTSVTEDQDFGFYPPNCPNATVRQESASNYLPDCRAYELVSPVDAGGASIYPEGPSSPETSSPAHFAFGGFLDTIPGAGDAVNVWGDLYVATRTDTGWKTKYVGIPGAVTNETNGPPGESSNGWFLAAPAGVRSDTSLSRFIDWNDTNMGFASPNPPPNFAPHIWSADGTSLGEWPTAAGHPPGPFLNQSADMSHYYYISGGAVTARFGEYEELFTYEGGAAYDNNTETNTISPIAFAEDGTPIEVKGVPHASTDGTRVLMSTSTCANQAAVSCLPGELYMRVDDAHTDDIAKGHTVQYVGMTADASTVYFTSPDKLTAADLDNSTDLYVWHEQTNAVTLVSVGSGGPAGNSDGCSASWTELCGVGPIVNNIFVENFSKGAVFGNGLSDSAIASVSGDIYFYSPEQLDGTKGVKNQENVYLYRGGTVRYVATVDPAPFCETEFPGACSAGPVVRIQVNPDGSHMAFLTASRVTNYDNAKHTEMYTYSPANDEVKCVSCRPDNAPPTGDVWASANGSFMTDDGRTFFSTADSLVRRDTDGLRDVYEYVEGRAQLISSGTSGKDSSLVLFGINYGLFVAQLVGVSADGTDTYFSTYDTLVPEDRNGGFLKFYDARTGGGFPFIAPPAPCEAADECVGAGRSATPIPPRTSGAVLGAGGNATSKAARRHRHKAKGRHHKRRHHRTAGRHGHE